MSTAAAQTSRHGNAYNLFILVLTIVSLVVMVLMWLPLRAETLDLLNVYDNVICVIFLFDFGLAFVRAPSKRGYFIGERGWLDLLGSIPTFRGAEAVGVLRLARLSRLARITRLLRGQNKQALLNDLLKNRAQYAVLITVLLAFLVMATASVLVLNAESQSATGNIKTGGDALWWSVVTITTVGYGDFYPTTPGGRVAALFVMVMGVGIIGSLASIMASLLVVSPADTQSDDAFDATKLAERIDHVDAELAGLRQLLQRLDSRLDGNALSSVGHGEGADSAPSERIDPQSSEN